MIEFDKGIIYNSKLNEVKETINKLGNLSFDLKDINLKVERIDNELKKSIKDKYDNYDISDKSPFMNDELSMLYDSAIKKLDKINDTLKQEYVNYYKIHVLSKKLENSINDVDENNIDEVVSLGVMLLSSLKISSTVDYEIEEDIVNKVYKLIYKVIKLETIYSNNNTKLLNDIKKDDVDVQYISKLIKEDISKIKDNSEINDKLINLEDVDFNNNYLIDKNLIMLIILSNDKELSLRNKDKFLLDVDSYKQLLNDISYYKNERGYFLNDINELEDNIKNNKSKAFKKRLIYGINAVIVSSIIFGGSIGIKHLAKSKKYRTYTTTYDSYTDLYTKDDSYLSGKDESVKIVEYSPWDSPGYFRDDYERNVYSYDFSDLLSDYSDVSNYLNKNLKKDITYRTNTERVKGIPEDFGYGENKYIVTEVKKDLDDYIYTEIELPLLIIVYGLYISSVLGCDIFIMKDNSKKLKNIKNKLDELNEKLNRYKEIASNNNDKIAELDKKIKELKNLIESEYEALPLVIKNSEEVNKAKKLVMKK